MKTKQDIIDEWGVERCPEVYEAMDEWAEQESVAFIKWLFDHKWVPNNSFLWFNSELSREDVRFHKIEILFKAYKEQQQ